MKCSMEMIEAAAMVVLVLAIAYTGLTLYFQHRLDKKNEAFRKKMNNEI